jgi:rubrerythrin
MVTIPISITTFTIGITLENLKFAANGEHEECTSLYPQFATIADQEGFTTIANAFKMIAQVEASHERRYNILAKQVETKTVFRRDKVVSWKCRNCGYIHSGHEAPTKCPACGHDQAWYELQEQLE